MNKGSLPQGFVILSQWAPSLVIDLKYCGDDNLLGRPLKGYASDGVAVLTQVAARSLAKIASHLQEDAVKQQLNLQSPTLLIWEAYRPEMAGEDFWQWSQDSCEKTKPNYYPNVDKKDFFKLGYIAKQSSHSRGSTVDLTIIDNVNGKQIALDMGTPFDFMDPLSHPANKAVSKEAYRNRQFLKKLMAQFGWKGIEQEWWHFTYQDEPFPKTYFNFPVINFAVPTH